MALWGGGGGGGTAFKERMVEKSSKGKLESVERKEENEVDLVIFTRSNAAEKPTVHKIKQVLMFQEVSGILQVERK